MKKTYLIILDGYGLGPHDKGDAIFQGKTPYMDSLLKQYPYAKLKTHGSAVGLPEFQTGGSEVGHITIGAGREVKHLLTKINEVIESGEFAKNTKIVQLMKQAKKNNRLHLIGLMSDGGIHSFQPHLYGLLRLAKEMGIENIFIHAFLDGRDVGERTAMGYLKEIESQGVGTIATVGGRFFGMDRDNNWERTAEALRVMTLQNTEENTPEKTGQDIEGWESYIQDFYNTSTDSDYYIPPVCFDESGKIRSDDVVININFRTDRMRQISEKLTENFLSKETYGIFGPYLEGAVQPFHFGSNEVPNTLGQVVSDAGLPQLRISETEKFNHVTFFFSGQTKKEFAGEDRLLIASPKCKSYAEKPAMAAPEQTEALKKAMEEKEYSLIVQNYANADLVGHSGDLIAAEKATEVLDGCLQEIVPFAQQKGYEVFITADHGNADEMLNADGSPNASHTKNFVPFVWVSEKAQLKKEKGTLQDIAPTLLSVLGVSIPSEMEGEVIFSKYPEEIL